MKKEELEFILQEGESYLVEFKESVDKSLAKEISAFANASGGRIFVGIDDQNSLIGINVTNKIKSKIYDIARNIQPSVNIDLSIESNLIIIIVPEGDNKPYQCSDGFYIRMGTNSQKMDREQLVEFIHHEGKVKFEEQFNDQFNFEKDYDSNKLNRFLKLADITKNLDDITILENLGVAESQFMKNAGVLFFANSIDLLCEQAIITCAVFDGIDRIKILDRKDYKDDIITNINNALHFIKQAIKVEYVMTGSAMRNEIYEFPIDALREAIVNAVAHRDYFFDGAHTTIDVFDDRIEIGSPGGLPRGLTKENFGKKAVRRNQLIASLLQRCSLVENMGTGINKINQLCKENRNFEPEFKFDSFYTIIFKRGRKGVNEGVNSLLKIIVAYPGKRSPFFGEKLKTSIKNIERWLKQLKDEEKIEYKGAPKSGGYYVK